MCQVLENIQWEDCRAQNVVENLVAGLIVDCECIYFCTQRFNYCNTQTLDLPSVSVIHIVAVAGLRVRSSEPDDSERLNVKHS